MVRMRFQYPQALPQPNPQRFPIGTRVANPLEGRTGHIEGFDSSAGVYHLVFNDGHQEDVSDASVDRFVIHKPAVGAAVAAMSQASSSDDGDEDTPKREDPQKLMGAAVLKVVRDYEGYETLVGGVVEAYFPATGYYRLVFENGFVEDMRAEQTKKAVERAKRKRKALGCGEGVSDDDQLDAEARKKQRLGLELEPSDKRKRLETERLPSRVVAYEIIRKVLRAILAQGDVKPFRTDKQRERLSNDDVKPKKALEHFIEADGLKFLQKVLTLWMKKTETHPGAMLVLKILATMPGITAELVLASQIGKTLRGICRLSRQMDHIDPALGDLAAWVIRTWRRKVLPNAMSTAPSILTNQQAAESQGTNQPALYVLPAAAQKKLKSREAMTAHLHKLLTTEPEPPVVDAEPAFFLANYNSLGSIDKRRPIRQIIHIESLVERVRKKHEDQAKSTDDEDHADDDGAADGGVSSRRRIKFRRRDEIIQFSIHMAPAKLMATDRTKIMDARQRSNSNDDGMVDDGADNDAVSAPKLPPPNKLAAPVKSIIKTREQVIVPFNRIVWT